MTTTNHAETTALRVTAEILELETDQLTRDTDLPDAGLDSIRAMELADRLLVADVEVPFEVLMESRTIGQWGL